MLRGFLRSLRTGGGREEAQAHNRPNLNSRAFGNRMARTSNHGNQRTRIVVVSPEQGQPGLLGTVNVLPACLP